nr:MAG TPA: hypothetical protein [Caudoviricetes sp.]
MVHSITVKTDTKEIISKCKVASAGSDARSRCAWIVCKRVSKRLKDQISIARFKSLPIHSP